MCLVLGFLKYYFLIFLQIFKVILVLVFAEYHTVIIIIFHIKDTFKEVGILTQQSYENFQSHTLLHDGGLGHKCFLALGKWKNKVPPTSNIDFPQIVRNFAINIFVLEIQ